MADLTPSESSLVDAFVGAMEARDLKRREDSNSEIRLVRKMIQWKDVGIALLFFGGLIAGGVVTFSELAGKPTVEQMHEAVEARVAPIEKMAEENVKSAEAIETDVAKIEVKVDRIEDVQGYQLEQQAWEGTVLEHLGSKAKGKAPPRPEPLKAKERELLRK